MCVRASGPRQSGNGEMQKDISEDAFGVTRAALESFFPESLDDARQDPRWRLGGGPNSAGDGLTEALPLCGVAWTRKLIWKGSAR
jgi:hypothetical protein